MSMRINRRNQFVGIVLIVVSELKSGKTIGGGRTNILVTNTQFLLLHKIFDCVNYK